MFMYVLVPNYQSIKKFPHFPIQSDANLDSTLKTTFVCFSDLVRDRFGHHLGEEDVAPLHLLVQLLHALLHQLRLLVLRLQGVLQVARLLRTWDHALTKKKIKLSSYIRKFRVEMLQSYIWLTASSYMRKYLRISSYIIGSPSSFATAPFGISLYMRKLCFLFYQCKA